eukprot:TRINITY_DN9739_c0_g2_i2.p1 TRINITY_DN9739_c0_g2~~TRINITY_DN9739_c0_g2_i2.p1  ORF type:complete len:186 (+),score=19.01 TRINITY_DN9739_c0_g2_i2:1061-1618(+)
MNCRDLNYPLYEFTSSGLTHSCEDYPMGMKLVDFFPSKLRMGPGYPRKNFGVIEISWGNDTSIYNDTTITVRAHSATSGAVVIRTHFSLKDISFLGPRHGNGNNSVNCIHESIYGIFGWKRITSKPPLILFLVFFPLMGGTCFFFFVLVVGSWLIWRIWLWWWRKFQRFSGISEEPNMEMRTRQN